ncbi:YdcF family protein, partial [Streptomyces sp. HSW2009]|uniref:YdcF family protein n=1 Tax=Streptomyces sp. HSW2009 TaxID=3142890 RepID=UPI0032EE29AD
ETRSRVCSERTFSLVLTPPVPPPPPGPPAPPPPPPPPPPPRAPAPHYREHAIALGVPEDAVLVEPRAANTGQNITHTRALLDQQGLAVDSVMLICKPYMERRAYATCRKLWPEVAVQCASERIGLDAYLESIGDRKLVIDMLVGELLRIQEYPRLGFATEQHVPAEVLGACDHLVRAGFDSRLVKR